jgi:hypothetical protein
MTGPLATLDAYAAERDHERYAPKAFAALRAVLAEHRDTGDWCSCDLRSPCPTVRAITTALEAL